MSRFAHKVVLASMLALLLTTACDEDGVNNIDTRDYIAEESFSFNISHESRTAFILQGINGSVEVTGSHQASSISVSGVRRVISDSQEDADEHLLLLEVVVDSSTFEPVVRTEQPTESEGREYIVNYTVTMPRGLVLDASTTNGDVTVESIDANAAIGATNGRVFASGIRGSATMTVINGEIHASATLPVSGELDLGVTNGFIELEIPQETSAEFYASVVNGTITIMDLVMTDQTTTPQSVTGTLGLGSGTITVHAVNGTIVVRGS